MKEESFGGKVIDTTWGRIYFLKSENFGWKFQTPCTMTFTQIEVLFQNLVGSFFHLITYEKQTVIDKLWTVTIKLNVYE